MAPPATGSGLPYRRYIVGLPLQRSLFNRAAQAATTIGLPLLSSAQDFPARLDDRGDLFLDRSQVALLTRALSDWFTPETLDRMQAKLAAACDDLMQASEQAARFAAPESSAIGRSCHDLAQKMSLVLAFGILTKFVPDVLLQALRDAGDTDSPPFPEKSAGAELMRETFAFYTACEALQYTPQRLRSEWPQVSPEMQSLLIQFCQRQTGFGPLAWDSPGYENPNYVISLLHSAFDEVTEEQVNTRLSFAKRLPVVGSSAPRNSKVAALRRVLAFWLDFLERETWYARRAFFVGMVPLLRSLATARQKGQPEFKATDLLFFEVDELGGGTVDPSVIELRRGRYMDNAEYLSLHGVDPRHLARILEN